MAEPLVPRGELLYFAADRTGLRHGRRSELIQHRVLSTKLSSKLTIMGCVQSGQYFSWVVQLLDR